MVTRRYRYGRASCSSMTKASPWRGSRSCTFLTDRRSSGPCPGSCRAGDDGGGRRNCRKVSAVKVFLSTDMEGTAGVVDWSQVRGPATEYEYYRAQLQAEVNAAIDGALAAGATEFLVNDSHSTMQNLRPDELHGRASYLSGKHKPMYMMEGLDASFDAAMFVSYHGSAGATSSVLHHTYNPRAIAEVRLNGRIAGESGVNALVALAYGVPVVLISGDQVTIDEAQPFCPGSSRSWSRSRCRTTRPCPCTPNSRGSGSVTEPDGHWTASPRSSRPPSRRPPSSPSASTVRPSPSWRPTSAPPNARPTTSLPSATTAPSTSTAAS